MTTSEDGRPAKKSEIETSTAGLESPFKLERIFEDLPQIFKPYRVSQASSPDVIIAVDTNVLLLPYTIRKDGLPKLKEFYQKLRSANRLFLPARVAREFIVNRDKKLSELLKMISDVKSRINIGETKLSPILDGVKGSEQLMKAGKALAAAKEQYFSAISDVEDVIRSWSGDDPVTAVYGTVFDAENIVSPRQSNDALLSEWAFRLKEHVPPGYKDGGKADTGIGDFLIWKSLLDLGDVHKKDLVFVTGEEKADWFVRANGGGAYPRPELVAEYRKHSGGRSIRLAGFHDVLREMSVAPDIVTEIERAEIKANSALRAISNAEQMRTKYVTSAWGEIGSLSGAEFRLHYGGEKISFASEGLAFMFQVSEAGENSIWVYPNDRYEFYALGFCNSGDPIDISNTAGEAKPFRIFSQQLLSVRDKSGNTLVSRLVSANLPRRDQRFDLDFLFVIFGPGEPLMAA